MDERTRWNGALTARGGLLFACCLLVAACGSEASTGQIDLPAQVIGSECGEGELCETFEGTVCLEGFPGGYCSAECGGGIRCPGDTICVTFGSAPVCADVCFSDSDCRDGFECDPKDDGDGGTIGVCDVPGGGGSVDPGGDGDVGTDDGGGGGADAGPTIDVGSGEDAGGALAPFGSACGAAAECDGGELSPRCLGDGQGFPGGYCSADCDPGAGECGDIALCLETSVGGLCVAGCTTADACRPGYECCNIGDSGACLPEGLDASCEAPDPDPDPDPGPGPATTPPEPGEVGAGCSGSADCSDGDEPVCFDQVPGGYCTSFGCDSREDCGPQGVCAQTPGGDFCLRECADDGGCRDGQVCCDVGSTGACLDPRLCRF